MYTIVVADDEEELRRAIIERVDWESIGFTVAGEASNGADALEIVERIKPDLLLTDIRMPFVSGIELARQVREICPSTHIAYLSGYDDFSYAQQAIQYNIISYMLKPISVEDLTKELSVIKQKMDKWFREFAAASETKKANAEEFAMPLLLDDYPSKDDAQRENKLLQQAHAAGLIENTEDPHSYAVMTISVFNDRKESCTLPEHVHSVDSILKKYMKHVSFYTGGKIVSLLLSTEKQMNKYLHILVREIAQNVERIMHLSCLLGISRTTDRLSGLNEAYREAVSAMSYSHKTKSSVHYIADEERMSNFDTEEMLNTVGDIETLIRSGNREEIDNYLNRFFLELEDEGGRHRKMNFLLIQMFAAVFKILYAVTDGEEGKEQFIPFVEHMSLLEGTVADTEARLKSICFEARDIIANQRKKSSVVFCEKAVEMIEKEYADPFLSLVSVSESINISPNYLSALIKKQTGKTFMALLTQKRCETAKELLTCSTMKIREIAEKCGYNDQHYFSYCFKKYSGVSPNALRRGDGADKGE